MDNSNFELILEENSSLNDLIKEKSIKPMTKLPKLESFDTEFLEWLSPKYLEAFIEVFESNIGTKKEARIVTLIKSPRYCNKETVEKINSYLVPHLNQSLEKSEELTHSIRDNEKDLEVLLELGVVANKVILSYINKAIFSFCSSPEIDDLKNKIIDNCLTICTRIKRTKASDEIAFGIFNSILDKLRPLQMNSKQKLEFSQIEKKSNSSKNKYIIISIVVVLLMILKLIF